MGAARLADGEADPLNPGTARVGVGYFPPRLLIPRLFTESAHSHRVAFWHPFKEVLMNQELFDKGLKHRREVLGAEYVDASLKGADEFTRPIQEFVTQYCWGDVWDRPGLDRRTRSFLNLAMLTALNRPHEIKLHVRGAINNGVTKAEIGEVFLQSAIYCGVPAALDSFRVAKEVFKEMNV
jgi:4-carboxymuconolactone decarboxylase